MQGLVLLKVATKACIIHTNVDGLVSCSISFHRINRNTHRAPKHEWSHPSLGTLIFVEDQSPDLNTLPRLLVLGRWVDKRCMRHSPRTTIELRVVALDEHNLLRRLPVQVEPPMAFVGPNGERGTFSVWVDEGNGHEIRLGNRVRVCNRQRILEHALDGAPDVDDLMASAQQRI